MSQPIAQPNQWQAILQQKRRANIEYWLYKLDSCQELSTFVLQEYDNLLRTLESALQQDETFDLAYRLIQKLAVIVFGYSDWGRWLVYLQEAAQISHRLQKKVEHAYIMERMAHIYSQRAEYEQAYALYQESAKIFEELGDWESYAFTLSRLGITTCKVHQDIPKSIALCNRAIELAQPIGNNRLNANVYDALSTVYHDARDWRMCLQIAQLSYEFAQDTDLFWLKEHLQMRIIEAHVFLEEWNAVAEEASTLTELFLATGNVDGFYRHKVNLGVAAYKQGNYKAAETLWQEALSLQSQVQRPSILAHISNNLGMVYTKLEEWEEAKKFLDQAIAIHKKWGADYEWANSMDNLADFYEAQGNKEMCRVTLEEVLTQLQDVEPDAPVQKLLNIMRQRLKALL